MGLGRVEAKSAGNVLKVEVEDCIDDGVREAPLVIKLRKFMKYSPIDNMLRILWQSYIILLYPTPYMIFITSIAYFIITLQFKHGRVCLSAAGLSGTEAHRHTAQ